MKPCATFRIDGALLQAPEERFLPASGKSVWEIIVEVAGYNGKSPNLYRIRVRDGRDVAGMKRGQRVRVEGNFFSTQGKTQLFYDLYADSVLPFAGEPSRLGVQPGAGQHGNYARQESRRRSDIQHDLGYRSSGEEGMDPAYNDELFNGREI